MRTSVLVFSCAAIISVIVAGCGEEKSNSGAADANNQLTASDLALLTDFHAWKVSIPQTQQPVKAIRLVIVNQGDSTTITKFDLGSNLRSSSSFLLGIRVERETFMGHILVRDSKGGGIGWDINFTNALADLYPAWSGPGTLVFNGIRADLATSTWDNKFDKVLAIELEK